MDKELLKQFRMLAEGMAQMEERLLDKMATKEELRAAESRIKIYIENAVTDKIRALFDGYQSALENQALLKVSHQTIARELDEVKARLAALESRIA